MSRSSPFSIAKGDWNYQHGDQPTDSDIRGAYSEGRVYGAAKFAIRCGLLENMRVRWSRRKEDREGADFVFFRHKRKRKQPGEWYGEVRIQVKSSRYAADKWNADPRRQEQGIAAINVRQHEDYATLARRLAGTVKAMIRGDWDEAVREAVST